MDITGIGSVAELIRTGIDKIWPDKSEALKAKMALEQAIQDGRIAEMQAQFDNAKAQLEVNAKEATNASIFVSGWRPFIGWVCGAGFAYAFVLQPLLVFILVASGHTFPPDQLPEIDFATMSPILLGMLGLGGMRSFEKTRNVARSKLGERK